jgi:hypothetical protein
MKKNIIIAICCLIFFSFSRGQPAASSRSFGPYDVPDNSAPAKFALLIGVNKYNDPRIPRLDGTENDVRLMAEVLTESYGFDADAGIKKLLSSNPDAGNKPKQKVILDAFSSHLIENAKKYYTDSGLTSPDKGAMIVFYYSGHGSTLPDDPETNDEPDGRDEAIVPMDSNLEGSKHIRDDELNKLFDRLKTYTSNVLFIFDSCHSGTVTRGNGIRGIPGPSTSAARGDNANLPDDGIYAAGEGYVAISSSLPGEVSQETPLTRPRGNTKEVYGVLTYYLAKALSQTAPTTSYREIMETVKTVVSKQKNLPRPQHPQIEGDIDRALFGSAASRGRRGFVITETKKAGNDSILTIAAGKSEGAYAGGAAAIYNRIDDAKPMAVGEIIEPTGERSATVRVTGKDVPETAVAVIKSPFFSTAKRAVVLDTMRNKKVPEGSDTGFVMIKRLEKELATSDFVTVKSVENPLVKGNNEGWDIAVVRSTYEKFLIENKQPAVNEAPGPPREKDEGYYLAAPGGNPLFNFWINADDPESWEKLQAAIENFVRRDNLRSLNNVGAAIGKGVSFRVIKLKSAEFGCKTVDEGPMRSPVLYPGDQYVIEITNKSGQPVFPYLYSLETNGSIEMLYDSQTDGDRMVDGETIRSSRKTARGCFVIYVEPPYGVQTIKLVVTARPFKGEILKTAKDAKGQTRDGSPFEAVFAQASTNTRDGRVTSFGYDGWAAASLDIEIRKK